MSSSNYNTPLEKVLSKIQKVKKTGGVYTARCPAHQDKNPSLSISASSNGTVLLKCFAGCRVEDIVAALGLEMRDLFPDTKEVSLYPLVKGFTPLRPCSEGISLEKLAETKGLRVLQLKSLGCSTIHRNDVPAVRIPYADQYGEIVAVRFRLSLDGERRFTWRRGDHPLLYGLGRLKEIRTAGWVLLVEGESDCWTGWAYQLPLLGLPGKTIWHKEWASYFEGLEVYLWQEPDAPDLTERITPDIPNLRIIEAPEGIKDISEAHLQDLDVVKLIEDLRAKARPAAEILREREAVNLTDLRRRAADVLNSKKPLALVVRAIRGQGYGGNIRPPLLIYLAATSRLLAMRPGAMPVHVALIGQPGAGKNYAISIVLLSLPEEGYHIIDAGSPRVLIYDDVALRHRVLVFGEADSLPAGEDNPAASAVRNLLQDHHLHYDVTVRDPETGNFTVHKVRKEGPTVLITTATRRLGAQLDSRLFSLEVPDDQSQIRSALQGQAMLELHGTEESSEALPAYQALLQVSAPWDVVVPFAEELAEAIGRSPAASRILRDYARLLSLIKAVAVLNHRCRIYGLVRDVYRASVTGASNAVRQAIQTVVELKARGCERITITVVAAELSISKMAASGRIRTALRGGWLVNGEYRKGYPFDLDIGEPLPDEEGLPKPSALTPVNQEHFPIPRNIPSEQGCKGVKPLTNGYKDTSFIEDLPPDDGENLTDLREVVI
ncbi:putative DNA primase/helicase [Candidatus Hakubella thermalkaliphila]|uniref:Putative DNA primase/helicase n=1 Tax=Candidatus Hakubella thermalkaliphila TaxID=2754717 RepID=A0A6V8NES3_9ACTN|nr:CHC2 zinc finger domain-containing protein [Candidatus Hakubella thermalkaliphila]GFP18678.1 putative DNA primase/helicase [Candidatus Hakubella thermalkaliphila]